MKLKEISKNNKGDYGIGASSSPYDNINPEYLRITDITDDSYVSYPLPTVIDTVEYPEYKNYFLNHGDIVFARTGNSTGRNYFFALNKKIVFAGFLIRFNINHPDFIPKYVGYYCQTRSYWEQIGTFFNGSTRNNINAEQLGELVIPKKTIEIQQHIVDTIGSIDDLIEKNNKIKHKINQITKLIYLKYENIKSDNKIYLSEVTSVVTGKQNANIQTNDGQYPFYSCSENIGKSPQYSFDGESILIAGNGVIDVKYYHGKFEAYQRTYVLMPNRYFYLFLEKSKREIEKLTNISQGSVIKFITKPMIEDISIPLNEQSIIYDEKIGKLIRKISNLEKNNTYLENMKKNLLEKFFQ